MVHKDIYMEIRNGLGLGLPSLGAESLVNALGLQVECLPNLNNPRRILISVFKESRSTPALVFYLLGQLTFSRRDEELYTIDGSHCALLLG